MIRRAKTTLVLGAGASMAYGFPSGPRLRECIIAGLDEGEGQQKPLYLRLREAGYTQEALQVFLARLRNLPTYSIDRFLEANPPLREIGCFAIAAELVGYEVTDALLHPSGGDWYQYLFNELLVGQEYRAGWLRVLTFNYDRSLEQYLFNGLVDGLGWAPERAAPAVSTPNFIHLHGQLGDLPWWYQPPGSVPGREYSTVCNPAVIEQCVRSIKVIGDSELSEEAAFEDAHEILEESHVICFLWFAYDPKSLTRLRIAEFAEGRVICGTAHGLPQTRINATREAIPSIRLDARQQQILPYLERVGVLSSPLKG